MDRKHLIDDVATDLILAENDLDRAFASVAALAGRLATARVEAGLAIQVGSSAVRKIASALDALSEVRVTIADAHKDLAVVNRALGQDATRMNGGDKPAQASLADATPTSRNNFGARQVTTA